MASSALRWAAPAPRGVVFLSAGQRIALAAIRRQARIGPTSSGRLAGLLAAPSRGQVYNRLTRLRQLELIAFYAWPKVEPTGAMVPRLGRPRRPSPGRDGRLLVWIPPAARRAWRRAIDDAGRWRSAVTIALTSTSFGGFSEPERAAAWWKARLRRLEESGCPPGARGGGARAGPRRGRRPPIAIRLACPAGHRVPATRISWREGPPRWTARYAGRCRRCRVDAVETIAVELPIIARTLSPAELTDPALRARRAAMARSLLEDPGLLNFSVRARLERDYLDE